MSADNFWTACDRTILAFAEAWQPLIETMNKFLAAWNGNYGPHNGRQSPQELGEALARYRKKQMKKGVRQ